MAMSEDILGPALVAARDSIPLSLAQSDPESYKQEIAKAEAKAFIDHIRDYMEVGAVANEGIAITVTGSATGSVSSQGQTQSFGNGDGKIQ